MNSRIILALDNLQSLDVAIRVAQQAKAYVWGYKVHGLLISYGTSVVTLLKEYGWVFADLKLHDISSAVRDCVYRLAIAGANLISVHAASNFSIDQGIASFLKRCDTQLVGVTNLTSMSDKVCKQIYGQSTEDIVRRLVKTTKANRLHGIVCPPTEVPVAKSIAPNLLVVAPGITPKWFQRHDEQVRTASPTDVIKGGADLIVIGRPILQFEDIQEALEKLNKEVEAAVKMRG